jgi:site-specific DNA-methyltransferase (adenine-specific)
MEPESASFGRPDGLDVPARAVGPEHAPVVNTIVHGDSVTLLPSLPSSSVHLILSDIPYGIGAEEWDVLHSNTNSAYLGSSPAQERAGAVFQKRGKPLNGWSEADRLIPQQYHDWCSSWASEWYRVLVPGGSAFVFAGRRLQHRCVTALEEAGFTFKDMLAWVRPQAVHRAQRVSVIFSRRGDLASSAAWEGWRVGNLRPRFEPILWFVKPYPIGTTIADNILAYGVGAFNQGAYLHYASFPDNFLNIGFETGEGGLHPTQKPVRLMGALIELVSKPGQTVLDPFAGSGSTLVAARRLSRQFLGYEIEQRYVEVARRRLSAFQLSLLPHIDGNE